MADEEKRPSIFDLYAGESEPIELADDSGRTVTVKFRKRTEAQRREAIEYADTRKSRYLEVMAARRAEVAEGPFSQLTREQLIEAQVSFMEVQARAQGLDLFDDIEPEEGEMPETLEELETQRDERLKTWLDDRRAEFADRSEEQILAELVETAVQNEYAINTGFAHMEMTIVLTCVDAETGERVFENTDQLYQLQPEVLDMLRAKLNEFLMPENEKHARGLSNDPNSSRTSE